MEKKFKLGFTIGRFQFFHEGHKSLVDKGLELCDKFVVLVGSSDKSRIKGNPFTFEERKEMIENVYGDKVIVLPVFDLGIGYVPQWGDYLLNTIKFNLGEIPDFYIGGVEEGRNDWLTDKYITRVLISRSLCPKSASACRYDLARTDDEEIENQNKYSYKRSWQNGFYSVEQLKRWAQIIRDSRDC